MCAVPVFTLQGEAQAHAAEAEGGAPMDQGPTGSAPTPAESEAETGAGEAQAQAAHITQSGDGAATQVVDELVVGNHLAPAMTLVCIEPQGK